ncbi:MAG TPA: hypothetical protein VIK72_13610 [Clostridiaceae bacterium]
MAFKDSFKVALSTIAKSVTEGAANVSAKSGEMIEVVKLKGTVHAEEEKIKKIYGEIGKLYYDIKKNPDASEEGASKLLELEDSIDEAKKVLDDLQDKIQEAKSKKNQ